MLLLAALLVKFERFTNAKSPSINIAPPPLPVDPNAFVLSKLESSIVALKPFTYIAPPDNVAFVFSTADSVIVAFSPSINIAPPNLVAEASLQLALIVAS